MGRRTQSQEAVAETVSPDALDVETVTPILAEADHLRAKVEADRLALEESQAQLAAIEARAREAATPDIRRRIMDRAKAEAERVEHEITECRLTLADAERKLAELGTQHAEAMSQHRAKRAEAIAIEREVKRLSVIVGQWSFQIRHQDKRADDARARLAELTGSAGLPRK